MDETQKRFLEVKALEYKARIEEAKRDQLLLSMKSEPSPQSFLPENQSDSDLQCTVGIGFDSRPIGSKVDHQSDILLSSIIQPIKKDNKKDDEDSGFVLSLDDQPTRGPICQCTEEP